MVFFAIGLHEYAHCKFADMAGDPTPGIHGRVTLNLTKHFELFGTLMMLFTAIAGVGIGWGKPAPMDPNKMRNPRWDFFIAVAAGPISNILQAVVWAFAGRVMLSMGLLDTMSIRDAFDTKDIAALLIYYGVFINLSLAFFNLFPLGPLDGHWLIGLLMPDRARDRWFWWNARYGWYVLIGIVLLGQLTNFSILWSIMGVPVDAMARLLLGPFVGGQ